MNILIDTHILICREFDRTVHRHLQGVIRLLNDLNYRLVVHPLSLSEVEKDRNIKDKSVLLSKMRTYSSLDSLSNPYDDEHFFEMIEKPKSEREKVDSYLLYCLYKKEVDFLLTEDSDIIDKASSLGIADKTMTLTYALGFFKKMHEQKKAKGGDVPAFCFYKKGPKWHIGEKGKESIFDNLKGFAFIHYLLCAGSKGSPPTVVYHLGKTVGGDKDPHGIISEEDKKMHGLNIEGPLYKERRSLKDKIIIESDIESSIEKLRKGIGYDDNLSTEDQMIKMEEVNEKIEKLKKYYKQQKNIRSDRDHTSKEEKVRVNVTRSISKALKEIGKDNSISSITRYLNKSTIITGDNCIYKPFVNDKPTWILYFNELTQ
jgi:hypothetical protein